MKKINKIENISSIDDAELYILEQSDVLSDVMSNNALDWLDDSIGKWHDELKKLEHEISIRDEKNINGNKVDRAIGLHFLIEHANNLYESSMVDKEDMFVKFEELEKNGFYLEDLEHK